MATEYCGGIEAEDVTSIMLRDGQWYEVRPKSLRVDAYHIFQPAEIPKDGSRPLDLTWYGGDGAMTPGSLAHWETPDGHTMHIPINHCCGFKSKERPR